MIQKEVGGLIFQIGIPSRSYFGSAEPFVFTRIERGFCRNEEEIL